MASEAEPYGVGVNVNLFCELEGQSRLEKNCSAGIVR